MAGPLPTPGCPLLEQSRATLPPPCLNPRTAQARWEPQQKTISQNCSSHAHLSAIFTKFLAALWLLYFMAGNFLDRR